jgi:hypothetical protein
MRKLSVEHKEKLRESKKKYYKQFTGKRPYKRGVEFISVQNINKIKRNALEIIEKFNDINREYGYINEEIIDREFKKEEIKYEYTSNFF